MSLRNARSKQACFQGENRRPGIAGELASFPPIVDEEEAKGEDAEARRVRHRKRLAEPDPPPKRLSIREERAALRALLDLPPSERG